jgi:transglutaminase-like putative cysteine protease
MTALEAPAPLTWKTRLLELARASWLPLALCGTLLVVAASSLNAARWVSEGARYTNALWLGALFGAALAVSRFRSRTALAYSALLGVAIVAEAVGRVLPTPEQLVGSTWTDMIWGMHVRALTLFDQVGRWAAAIAFGGKVRDNSLFIALAATLLWSAGLWLPWALIRRRQALAGLAPLAVLIALNNTLADRPAAEYAMFLAPMLLLLGYGAFRQARADWERRHISYAEYIESDWTVNAAVAVTAIVLLVVVSPLFGTPSGWRVLSELFRSAQSQTADTASRLFGDVNPPRAPGPAVTARTPDLRQIGSAVPQGDETVMWVTVSDPAPLPPEAPTVGGLPPTHYWRSQVFAAYTGQGWEAAGVEENAAFESPGEAPPGRYVLQQRFEIVAAHGPELFAVNAPITASAGASVVALPLGADALLRGETSTYTVTSWATQRSKIVLVEAANEYSAEVRATYLQLPANLPQRVRDLAQRIAGDAPAPLAKAERLQTYLRATYPYLLIVPPHAPEQDAVDYFLFDAPGGNCNYYASAMVVMLRTLDVPARVAVGYAMGDFDFERGAYRVSANSAHAWVEVYVPDAGWIEFEPTSNRAALNYGEAQSSPATPSVTLPVSQPQFNWLGLALIALATLALGWMLWRFTRQPHIEPAARLYWRVRRALAWAGLRGSVTTTPDEFTASLTAKLAGRATLSAALAQATALYERALYGSRRVNGDEAWRVEQLWRSARWEWLAVWVRELGARLRRK